MVGLNLCQLFLTSLTNARKVQIMKIGIVTSVNDRTHGGSMRDSTGVEFAFSYSQGQSFVVDDSDFLPHFTGHHDQSHGELKLPEIGDPVIFITPSL